MFDKCKYDNNYIKENYHRVNLCLPKEYGPLLKAAAEKCEMSKNAFIKDAIDCKFRELGDL